MAFISLGMRPLHEPMLLPSKSPDSPIAFYDGHLEPRP